MIYYENVVKILWTWHFFFTPIFGNAIATIANFFFLFPYFGNGIATISLSIFFLFSLRALHAHLGSRIGHRKFSIPVAKIQHFLSPPSFSSLSYFWLNFDNSNTEIQSLSLKDSNFRFCNINSKDSNLCALFLYL